MRRMGVGIAAVALVLSGCSQSTLSADDQDFCAQQEDDPVAFLRNEVDKLLEDNHWSSGGEAFAFQTVTLDRADNFLSAQNVQDQTLAGIRDDVVGRIFDAKVAADSGDTIDKRPLQALHDSLDKLGEFCDEND